MAEADITYISEVELHFQLARGGLFLLSPRDWALVEKWEKQGIPLVAVLRGIDAAMEKLRRRSGKARVQVNSLAYCEQAVIAEAQALVNVAPITGGGAEAASSLDSIRDFVARKAGALREGAHDDLAVELESIDLEELHSQPEELEARFRTIEDRMVARVWKTVSPEALRKAKRDVDLELKPYRGRRTTDQLASLEKQFLERRLVESAGLPRLSLFYL